MLKTPIMDREILYRRVPHDKNLYFIQPDGVVKVSSSAFLDPFFRPSVDRAELCKYDPRKTQLKPTDGIVSLVTLDVRSITIERNNEDGMPIQTFKVDVEHMPIQDNPTIPDNIAHAEIYTDPACSNRKVFHRLREKLAQLANQRPWEIELHNL